MITGKFVSCYSCAGEEEEGSDLTRGSVVGWGEGGACWFLSRLSRVVQTEPAP